MNTLAFDAMIFAMEAHKDHKRKYTGAPYAVHLAEVAGMVATVAHEILPAEPQVAVAVAWLHDCVEDCSVTVETIRDRFGPTVAFGVGLLSDMEVGNRAFRKKASCLRLSKAPGWVQTIKCCDLYSNTSSIVLHDPSFAHTYLKEKRDLLTAMEDAHPYIYGMASAMCYDSAMSLKESGK